MSWETVKLGDVTAVSRGTTITKKQTVDGNIPVIGGGIKPTYFHNEFNRDAGVITISGSGASAGFVNYWEEPIFASDCSTVQPFDKSYETKFLYFFLLSKQQFIFENFRSGVHNHTSMQRILRRWISLKLISQCKNKLLRNLMQLLMVLIRQLVRLRRILRMLRLYRSNILTLCLSRLWNQQISSHL